ncbi:hypothetical protein PYCCODRAFT_1447577 [Trametes coccinea BRFM310]|uniref:Uncharacterized protein n=1 Tax=Trametes coccinea (strain BRFM310) TaxID=1353009 RepID=A0A1Y2IBV0_TRAC3|nr:hypothetical protein PYCCODRAFT_1447577 [Trametes coccinea BRFM310]
MKAKATRQSNLKASRQPYDGSKRTQKPRAQPKTSTSGSSTVPSPCVPLTMPTTASGAVLYRDFCVQHVKERYRDVKPRNDWELLRMTEVSFKGTPEEIYAILDKQYQSFLNSFGEECEWMIAKSLNQYIEPTGLKPQPKENNKYIHICPIPDTKYSIRLFPGSISAAEYCLDFVDSASGEPVNSPFEFELWGIPDPDAPWLGIPITMQLRSMEQSHGIKQADILPGHEKFLLRDGQTCVLIRPGKPKVRFTVPVRKHPDTPQARAEDEIVLKLPKVIE